MIKTYRGQPLHAMSHKNVRQLIFTGYCVNTNILLNKEKIKYWERHRVSTPKNYPIAIYFRARPVNSSLDRILGFQSPTQWIMNNHLAKMAKFQQRFRRVKKVKIKEIKILENSKCLSSTVHLSRYDDKTS